MISKATIDKVFDAIRVEEVIGDFVQLKKSGSNYKGLSPFTDEKTPSFMVSPVKQIWKDFSSGKGGNAVAFIMEHEHFTYPEAIKYLAKKYGIEVEETEATDEQKQQASERESMYLVSEYAQKYFEENLWNTELGKAIGLSYFKERGFNDDTIKKFGLGYSLDQWEAFTRTAMDDGYQLEFLEKTGLTIVKEERKFDRFKGRVMFPIHSMSGRVLGFGGRILTNDKKAAKYLNSPESDIYHKSKVLYGIYQAKQAIAKEDNCYLVEGYTDVIQFHQSGIHNVVSSSGTALTAEQIRLINRLTKNITVLFDGDAAGLRASLRGIDLILEEGMNVKVCTFPEGEDPDSFAKNNAYEDLVLYLEENAKDFIQFKASLLMQEAKNDPIKRAEVINDIVRSIAKIPNNIQREVYVQECSKIMDISEEVLFNTLAQLGRKELRAASRKERQERKAFEVLRPEQQQKVEKVDRLSVLEHSLIKSLLLNGSKQEDFEDLALKLNDDGEMVLEPEQVSMKVFQKMYLDLQQDEIAFANQDFQELFNILVERYNRDDSLDMKAMINELTPSVASKVTDILMNEERYELHDWERKNIYPKVKDIEVAQQVSDTILNLRCYLIERKVLDLQTQTSENKNDSNGEILGEIRDYYRLRMLLSKKLRRVLN